MNKHCSNFALQRYLQLLHAYRRKSRGSSWSNEQQWALGVPGMARFASMHRPHRKVVAGFTNFFQLEAMGGNDQKTASKVAFTQLARTHLLGYPRFSRFSKTPIVVISCNPSRCPVGSQLLGELLVLHPMCSFVNYCLVYFAEWARLAPPSTREEDQEENQV